MRGRGSLGQPTHPRLRRRGRPDPAGRGKRRDPPGPWEETDFPRALGRPAAPGVGSGAWETAALGESGPGRRRQPREGAPGPGQPRRRCPGEIAGAGERCPWTRGSARGVCGCLRGGCPSLVREICRVFHLPSLWLQFCRVLNPASCFFRARFLHFSVYR